MTLRPLLALTLTGSLALTGSQAFAGGGYSFVDLGTLGGADSGALGINDMGQVVGWSAVPGCTTTNGIPCRRAFLWENGVMTDLGFLAGDEGSAAVAINNSGEIVGNSERDVLFGSGTYHAVSWSGAGAPTPLPDLGQGTSWVNDINEAGVAIGYATDPGVMRDHVVSWQAGVLTDMSAGEPHSYNRGLGINNSGFVVGMAWDLFSPNDSIIYDGHWNQLGGFGQFENSEAHDINDSGLAVGTQAFPNGNWHAATWSPGQGATDLGVLPGHSLGYLLDVNETGFAVGYSLDESGPVQTRAIFTDGVTLTNLNDLLPAGTNAVLWDAMEINEAGDIVGAAEINGNFHAYLLRKNLPGGQYCSSLANSTGQVAEISATGSASIAANNLELVSTSVPNTPFLFFYGPVQVSLPFGDGMRCVGGNLQRLTPAVLATGNTASVSVDLAAQGIQPGSVNFQCWFRDPAAMGAGYNTSDAIEVIFTP